MPDDKTMLQTFYLERRDRPHFRSSQLDPFRDGDGTKHLCMAVYVNALDEAQARELASQPMVIPKGCKVGKDNILVPPPPYAWCHDGETAIWADPAKSTAKAGPTHEGKIGVGMREFSEVPMSYGG